MTSSAVARLFRTLGKSLTPPPVLSYSEWATQNFRLVSGGVNGGPFRPWKFQRGILDAIGDPTIERVSIIKAARTGYALALDTPIATTSGWTTMGAIEVGDMVFDERGEPCSVIFCSEVFEDHDCYRLSFDDGSQIVADAGHRWFVESDRSFEHMLEGKFVRGQDARGTTEGVLTTKQIAKHWRKGKRTNFAIPVAGTVNTPACDLPIPPYTLGLWLGDGHSDRGWITQHYQDVATADFVREEGVSVEVVANDVRYPNNRTLKLGQLPSGETFSEVLRRIGLRCTDEGRCAKKRIPSEYLRASPAQRLALLQGLMDSDGTADKRGRAEFAVTAPALADAAYELAASLGLKPTLNVRPRQGGMKFEQYRVSFFAAPGRNPFRLPRKAARVKVSGKPSVVGRRRIVNVEQVPTVPTRCISVDSPNRLFLAGKSFIPTHNTTSLVAGIAAIAANDPARIMLLMPTDDDARGIAVDEIDPAFKNNPLLAGLMTVGRFDGRNTLTHRTLTGGGSLKINSARSPNNLRRHTVDVLYCDEVDGMKPTAEGDPLVLAERRTMQSANRKIVFGSTPTDEATSVIARKYEDSDQRIFEVPCIECSRPFEMLWEHLKWERGKPETVVCVCPHCKHEIDERFKPQMIEAGDWRATRPERRNHAGFRINSLMSLFSNAAWPRLVEEYERAEKNGHTEMQGFQNTVLGRVWSAAIDNVNEHQLMARRRKFGIKWDHDDDRWREDIPEEVAYITGGVDVQPDRLEVLILGWSLEQRYVLGHHIIRGNPLLKSTWEELDAFLSTTWKHPLGGQIGFDAVCVDSGYLTQAVYDYCEMVQGRRIVAIKGDEGPRPILKAQKKKRRNYTATAYILGVDQLKTDILMSLPHGNGEKNAILFSDTLEEDYFLQLTAERREVHLVGTKSVVKFVPLPNRRTEGLDITVYAIAAKQLCQFDFTTRYEHLKGEPAKRVSFKDLGARLHR